MYLHHILLTKPSIGFSILSHTNDDLRENTCGSLGLSPECPQPSSLVSAEARRGVETGDLVLTPGR